MMDGTERYDIMAMDDMSVSRLMAELQIGLTVREARAVQSRILGRCPTLTELILFGIEGSEHCSYKSSRPYLELFTTDGPDVIIGAKEDAGIIRVARDASGEGYAVVISHESHNHPSQIVPYEGAATGVGGNVRDVCCMGARVIALADDLRFGDIGESRNLWLCEQVVAGIAGYGNPIGVPNIGGGLQFDPGYNGNCLVTVVTLGAVRERDIIHSHAPSEADGYDLILVGKPTDNSGFGGASFASFNLSEASSELDRGAVQEPNAFLGRHLLRATDGLVAILRDRNLIHRVACKDLGAGGIACASVELADSGGYGARVDLDAVHTVNPAPPPYVVLCAETQERYLWVSPPEVTPLILSHFNETYALPQVSHLAQATVIGSITKETDYVVTSHGRTLVHARASDVTKGFLYHRPVGELPPPPPEPAFAPPEDLRSVFLALLEHENAASRAPVFNTYDKQVQALVSVEAGVADAGVIRPFDDVDYPPEIRDIGITLTCDQNPRFNTIDPYQGAVNAVAEAFCNTIAAGAVPIAISDCLCYGNPESPASMRQFVEGCKGVAGAASALNIPVIAGNVSLYNESEAGAIPPSPMIAMIGRIEHAAHALTSQFKRTDSKLLLVGERKDECGGSLYYELQGYLGSRLPRPDLHMLKDIARIMDECVRHRLILSCHDISEGGVALAVAEMAIASGIGCRIQTCGPLKEDRFLFSETPGLIIECASSDSEHLATRFISHGIPCPVIGETTEEETISFNNSLSVPLSTAEGLWIRGLQEKIT